MLANLPRGEYARLLPEVERVRLDGKQVLHDTGERIAHVYFGVEEYLCKIER